MTRNGDVDGVQRGFENIGYAGEMSWIGACNTKFPKSTLREKKKKWAPKFTRMQSEENIMQKVEGMDVEKKEFYEHFKNVEGRWKRWAFVFSQHRV